MMPPMRLLRLPESPRRRFSASPWPPLILLSAVALLPGCEVVGSTVIGAGAGTATGTGAAYTMDSITYKTFTVPLDKLADKTRAALRSMDFPVRWEERNAAGLSLHAKAGNPDETLAIEINLERLSPQVTRMRVVASRGLFLKDAATATEIIRLTSRNVEEPIRAQVSDQPTVAPASQRIR